MSKLTEKELGVSAGISATLAGRLRRRGMSDAQIIQRSMERRESEASRADSARSPAKTDRYVLGFVHARRNLRESLPEIIASMKPAERVRDRVAVLATVDFLLGEWLDVPENDASRMPVIDWKVFVKGTTPAQAERLFTALQQKFASWDSANVGEPVRRRKATNTARR